MLYNAYVQILPEITYKELNHGKYILSILFTALRLLIYYLAIARPITTVYPNR